MSSQNDKKEQARQGERESITERINPIRTDTSEVPDLLLLEGEIAEIAVGIIHNGGNEGVRQLAEILLILEQGIEAGETVQAVNTIDLLVELLYLRTADYHRSLDRFRAEMKGTLAPKDEWIAIELKSSSSQSSGPEAPNQNDVVDLDSSGGELPPLPMSSALRDALEADASRCLREPHAQVLAILEYHFGLYEPAPNRRVDVNKTIPGKESRKHESQD